MTCDFRRYRECSCETGECRVSGETKRGPATVKKSTVTRVLHVMAICAAFVALMAVVLLAAERQQKRIDTINQERTVSV